MYANMLHPCLDAYTLHVYILTHTASSAETDVFVPLSNTYSLYTRKIIHTHTKTYVHTRTHTYV